MASRRVNGAVLAAWLPSADTWSIAAHSRALSILGLALLATLACWQSFAEIIAHYSQQDYGSLPIVYAVVALLIWRSEPQLAQVIVRASKPGVAALVACVLAWYAARAAHVQLAEHVFAILMIPAFVFAVMGGASLRAVALPMALLLPAVPVGEDIYPLLMTITAHISTFLLQLCGVPAFRDGMFISLPGGEFQIVEACAGLNTFPRAR